MTIWTGELVIDSFARDRCAIAGIGTTDFSRESGRTTLTLATQAALAAARDANIDPKSIDGIVRCDADAVAHNDLATALGLEQLTYWGMTGAGGAAPCGMVGQAIGAILSGQASTVLVYRSLNGRSGRRWGRGRRARTAVGGDGSLDEFFTPYGLTAPGQLWAMAARRHFDLYGTTHEDLGHIAVAFRRYANANPAAQMTHRELTLEQHASGRALSSPLRLFDYCLESDGACAVIVTSTDRARDLGVEPVLIRAAAQTASPAVQGGLFYGSLMREDFLEQPSMMLADTLYRRAGVSAADIDVAQLYDCFTMTVLVQLEAYRFCPVGEGGRFAASGALGPQGAIPTNTSGGHMSEAYIHGMNHIVEGVRQMRGTSTSQVVGAETCLVTSGLPVATSALILRKDR